jgi:protein SCO1/2
MASWIPVRNLAFLLCALAVPAGAQAHDDPPPQRVSRELGGWPIDPFALVDHNGRKFTQQALRGQWTFMMLGDTRCAAPCAEALRALAGLAKRIEQSDAILNTRVVFVSLDPERDTPARLSSFLAPYDRYFTAATGPRKTLERLADDLGAAAARGSVVLVGPDGALRAEYHPPFEVKRLTADYLKTRLRK